MMFVVETESSQRDQTTRLLEALRGNQQQERETIRRGMKPEEVADIIADGVVKQLRHDLRMDEWVNILRPSSL